MGSDLRSEHDSYFILRLVQWQVLEGETGFEECLYVLSL